MTSTTSLGAGPTTALTKRLLVMREVIELTRRSRASIYADIAEGRFPRPIKTGVRSIAFLESDIAHWLDQKIRANEVVP